MKKILFISPTGTFDNGAEISIFYLMKYLASNGYAVYNVAPQLHREQQIKYYDRCLENGITTYFIPTLKWWWEDAPGGLPGNEVDRNMYYRDNIYRIRQYINQNEINLVITNTINMFQGAVAAACEGIPHYWLVHEFPDGEFGYYREKIDFIEEYSDEIYSVVGELNDVLNSTFQGKNIKKFAPYTEVEINKSINGSKRRIVSVGRLTERKNQLELIEAFDRLKDNTIELVFIGAWDEVYKRKCTDYIAKKSIKNVSFLGSKENPWSLVTDQDICVFSSAMETFGLVYVEAVLNGIPVILSDNPGHLSAFEVFDFGTLYELGNLNELTRKIEHVLKDFDEQKVAAVNYADIALEKFQIHNVYQEIIEDIEVLSISKPKTIRHLTDLVSTNEKKSKLAMLEIKVRRFFQKVKNRLKRNRK